MAMDLLDLLDAQVLAPLDVAAITFRLWSKAEGWCPDAKVFPPLLQRLTKATAGLENMY